MNLIQYKPCLLVLGSLCVSLNVSTSTSASEYAEKGDFNSLYLAQVQDAKSNGKTNSREYTFKAPDSKTISDTEGLVKVRGYKVEVYGSDRKLLQQVKDIEPTAFVKGNTIQVGIFSQQGNAENMIRKLAVKGFWARMQELRS